MNKKRSNSSNLISIHPWVQAVFICTLIFSISTVFVTRWTHNGPTWFAPEELNPIGDSLSKITALTENIPIISQEQSGESQKNSPFSPSDKKSQPDFQLSSPDVELNKNSSSPPQNIQQLQERFIPEFLHTPGQPLELFLPTVIVAYICIILSFIPSNNWTRLVVKNFLLILLIRYFIWRTICTLNFAHWASTTFSLVIYAIEAIGVFSFIIYTLQSIWSNSKKRTQEADRYSQDILSGRYSPSVDIFVPTYNEPEQVVYRTAIGCLAMDYPNKKVYILDDTRRPHIRALAEKLGCEYITRPDNKHAKAGNINNALPQTKGELIVIMDADFVPFKNFLTRTVGFFQQSNIALVQTPQTFYNPDHHARNLGLDHLVHDDLASFFGFSQSCRDVANAALCCGTSYVIRRTALESVGGYSTVCLAEDSPTSTKILTQGWRVIYLGEVLSMGESTRTYLDFIKQRVRWHHSNYQIFCCGEYIPIWSKMNLWQKSYFLTFYVGNFGPLFRAIFLLMPLMTLSLGISPIISTPSELIYYFVPYLLLLIGSYSWGTEYTCSYFWNEVYETILCYPNLKCLLFAIRNPFGLAFKVTRKGVKAENKYYNLTHTWPLLLGVILMVAVLCLHLVGSHFGLWQTANSSEFVFMFFLLIYNIIVMGIAFLAGIDQPERRAMDRFPLKTACKLTFENRNYLGYTNNISETGASITLINREPEIEDGELTLNFKNDLVAKNQKIILQLPDYQFSTTANLVHQNSQDKRCNIALEFANLSLEQNRNLVEIIYCDMTWWKKTKRPSGLDVFLAMISSFLKLRPLLTKY